MSATEYTLNQRDLAFVLFEQLKVQELCEYPAFKDFDRSQFEMVLDEAYKFARAKAAPLNKPADEEGCRFEGGQVRAPKGFRELYAEFAENGWLSMAGSQESGGQGLPMSVAIPAGAIFTGSNCSFALYSLLSAGVAHVLEKFGDEAIKARYVANIYSGRWSGTMVLTEPNAGSDVGNAKTTAEPTGDGRYKLRGNKIFITGGEHDLTENIIHMVLARVPGGPAGTKGLSLFIVPKRRVEADGSLGAFNNVVCTGIEHKLGIKGSATCALSFGDDGDCIGEIIGHEGDGIRIMFHMMNEARIDCGVQGAAQASAAYRNALAYAQERIQGSHFTELKNPQAARIAIVEHPDVRRMLLSIKAHTEGMNALLYYTAKQIDLSQHATDEKTRKRAAGLVELLTPICKAYCSDKGFEMCSLALQVYGGYGYTADYPAEQYLRDVRIAAIYEGANGIQAMDLLGRKLPLESGGVFRGYLDEVVAVAKRAAASEGLAPLAKKLQKATENLGMAAGMLATRGMKKDLAGSLLWAVPFLYAFGDVTIAHQLLWGAELASAALAAGGLSAGEQAFYQGKLAAARYFINVELPKVDAHYAAIMSDERSALDVPFEQLGA